MSLPSILAKWEVGADRSRSLIKQDQTLKSVHIEDVLDEEEALRNDCIILGFTSAGNLLSYTNPIECVNEYSNFATHQIQCWDFPNGGHGPCTLLWQYPPFNREAYYERLRKELQASSDSAITTFAEATAMRFAVWESIDGRYLVLHGMFYQDLVSPDVAQDRILNLVSIIIPGHGNVGFNNKAGFDFWKTPWSYVSMPPHRPVDLDLLMLDLPLDKQDIMEGILFKVAAACFNGDSSQFTICTMVQDSSSNKAAERNLDSQDTRFTTRLGPDVELEPAIVKALYETPIPGYRLLNYSAAPLELGNYNGSEGMFILVMLYLNGTSGEGHDWAAAELLLHVGVESTEAETVHLRLLPNTPGNMDNNEEQNPGPFSGYSRKKPTEEEVNCWAVREVARLRKQHRLAEDLSMKRIVLNNDSVLLTGVSLPTIKHPWLPIELVGW